MSPQDKKHKLRSHPLYLYVVTEARSFRCVCYKTGFPVPLNLRSEQSAPVHMGTVSSPSRCVKQLHLSFMPTPLEQVPWPEQPFGQYAAAEPNMARVRAKTLLIIVEEVNGS